MESVATAFKTGEYTSNGVTFGDGKLSDLKATVAAILLDREATSTVLDADPAYGGIREPVVKVLAFMRAMGYTPTSHDRNIYPKFDGMYSKVGQMAHESPDQFSFFLHDYQPPGQFAQAKLNTPPSQVLTLSTTISTVEGFFSMVRNGLTWIGGGFGGRVFPYYGYPAAGDHSQSVGYLSYVPDGATIEEKVAHIADLLTSGRMSSDVLAQIVASFDAGASDEMKIMVTQQLIATSPECMCFSVSRSLHDARWYGKQSNYSCSPDSLSSTIFSPHNKSCEQGRISARTNTHSTTNTRSLSSNRCIAPAWRIRFLQCTGTPQYM